MWHSLALPLPLAAYLPLQAACVAAYAALSIRSLCARVAGGGHGDSMAAMAAVFRRLDGAAGGVSRLLGLLAAPPVGNADVRVCMCAVSGIQITCCLLLPLALVYARERRLRARFLAAARVRVLPAAAGALRAWLALVIKLGLAWLFAWIVVLALVF